MLSHIPPHLKDAPIWTLSNRAKLPLDVSYLAEFGVERLHAASRGSNTYRYAAVKALQQQYPELLLTIRPRAEDGITLLDIEPEGMQLAHNPYRNMQVDYLEYSMSKGLHGIILDQIADAPNIFKDDEFHTEMFKANHFMIITENALPLPDAEHPLQHYQGRIDAFNARRTEILETAPSRRIADIDITEGARYVLDKIEPHPFEMTDDPSRAEFSYLLYLARTVIARLNLTDVAAIVEHTLYLAEQHLPYRDKHYKRAQYQGYGHITWREYTTARAVEIAHSSHARESR